MRLSCSFSGSLKLRVYRVHPTVQAMIAKKMLGLSIQPTLTYSKVIKISNYCLKPAASIYQSFPMIHLSIHSISSQEDYPMLLIYNA